MGKRTWIKVYCDNWLTGSMKNETLEMRGAWISLLVLAGNLSFSGEISLPNNVGIPDVTLSYILGVDLETWQRCKQRLIDTKRIKIQQNGTITITKWNKYQSEYSRQKKYRDKTVTQSYKNGNGVTKSYTRDIDRDIDREEDGKTTAGDAPKNIFFNLHFFDGDKTISKGLIQGLVERHGEYRVRDELEKAHLWYEANPSKRKKNLGRFLVNWFSKIEKPTPPEEENLPPRKICPNCHADYDLRHYGDGVNCQICENRALKEAFSERY